MICTMRQIFRAREHKDSKRLSSAAVVPNWMAHIDGHWFSAAPDNLRRLLPRIDMWDAGYVTCRQQQTQCCSMT